jgi:hypothetical protein
MFISRKAGKFIKYLIIATIEKFLRLNLTKCLSRWGRAQLMAGPILVRHRETSRFRAQEARRLIGSAVGPAFFGANFSGVRCHSCKSSNGIDALNRSCFLGMDFPLKPTSLNHWVVDSIPTRCISFIKKELRIKNKSTNKTQKQGIGVLGVFQ